MTSVSCGESAAYLYSALRRRLPDEPELLDSLAEATELVVQRLEALDLARCGFSDYGLKYLRGKLSGAYGTLQVHVYVLALALSEVLKHKSLDEVVLLDYGGGSGVMSLIAKQAGVGTVVYSDLAETCCSDATLLASILDVPIDHFLRGEINEIAAQLVEHDLALDAVCSFDVIEHVYDIEHHFEQLAAMAGRRLVSVSGSNANPRNPRVRGQLQALHGKCESGSFVQGEGGGCDELQVAEAYRTVRRRMIVTMAPELSDREVDSLVSATRGLREDDIRRRVSDFVSTGVIQNGTEHPTNACDPYSGCWAERLMDPEWVRNLARDSGFEARLLPGYYGRSRGRSVVTKAKNGVKHGLNLLIEMGVAPLMLTQSYYVLGIVARNPTT